MRYPRNALPEAFYHIMSRGNRKQDIFLADRDRIFFLQLLKTAVADYSWKCHSYCLMTNHYHLLIEATTGGLSDGMHLINSGYSAVFNKQHRKVGHVFQGRYISRLIKDDADFLTVVRYTALNPIKAGLTADPAEWIWSSYSALAGGVALPFLEENLVRSFFASPGTDGSAEYRAFIAERISAALNGDIYHIQTLAELFADCADQEHRKRLMSEAHFDFGYSMIDIARYLGVACSTVSRAIKAYNQKRV
jgi:putative transposase